jgi:putative membrane protein
MTYYALSCLLAGPLFPIFIIPAYFRYHTLRYRFDAEGVSMRWGILFRREIVLSYARFQDIHLSSNVVERWLGLARIQIQTASGSAKAEMVIEGLLEYELIRDFLYTRMRGQRAGETPSRRSVAQPAPRAVGVNVDATAEIVAALREVADELRRVREALATSESSRRETGGMS